MSSLIQILPEHVVNQIKAGEVIERPANIIKEILENSLDAGARDLSLHIMDEGLSLISLKDNGNGISFTDLPLAFTRHATSKLDSFDQLYTLNTFGFRGEALASIASVAEISCQTMTKLNEASSIEIHGGNVQHHLTLEERAEVGTHLYIRNLFFNTPVRLKFSQSKKSEKRHIEKTIRAFLLSHPEVKLSIKWDDLDKKIYEATDLKSRVKQVFYKRSKNSNDPLYIFKEYDDIKVHAYVSKESSSGFSYKEQFLFVNGRYFEDKKLHNAITRNLSHLWPERTQGHYCLFIELPRHKVDINIHPRKTQVKFQDNSSVFSLVSETLKNSFHLEAPILQTNERADSTNAHATHQNFFSGDTNFYSSKDLKKDYSQITPEQSNYEQSSTWSVHLNLSNQFAVMSSPENKYFLIDFYALANYLLSTNFKNDNVEPTPLLVSEIVNMDKLSDTQLTFLRTKGFELDKLQEGSFALRTLPRFLFNFKYQVFLNQLITNLLNKNENQIAFEISPFSSLSFLDNLISQSLSELSSRSIIIHLSNEKLKKLWS